MGYGSTPENKQNSLSKLQHKRGCVRVKGSTRSKPEIRSPSTEVHSTLFPQYTYYKLKLCFSSQSDASCGQKTAT